MTTVDFVRIMVLFSAVSALATGGGCVDRRFVIESNVPNAQVYIDNQPVGPAPVHAQFEYYGYYTIKLVHPDYETLVVRERIAAPWYAYPPFDFIAEVLLPFHIRDTRRLTYTMHQKTQTRTDDILNAAEALRFQGQSLPPPERPARPRPSRTPPPALAQPPQAPLLPGEAPGVGP